MQTQNRRFKNLPSYGNTVEFIKRLKQILETNDGTRSFTWKTVDCDLNPAPFNQNQETTVPLTHPDHMMSDLSKGFLTFLIELALKATGLENVLADVHHLLKAYVGARSANQIIERLQILCRNLSTGYNKNECIREGFAYSNMKNKESRKTRKFEETLYENVEIGSDSVAGTYINLVDYKDGQTKLATFELNVPFDNLLALQSFDLYCNRVVGELSAKLYVKPYGLVWAQVDPRQILENKLIMKGENITDSIVDSSVFFKRQFTQINNEADIINGETVADGKITYKHGNVSLICTNMRVLSLKSNMCGFGITDKSLAEIKQILSSPIPILSQQLEYDTFNSLPTGNGITATISRPLINATAISIMFPKHSNDITVFENPMYKDVQLTIGSENYPSEVISTQGARFLQYQLVASELDGHLQCTQEFEDSLTCSKNDSEGKRYKNMLRDATAFMLNFQTERPGADHCFDGLYYPNGIQIKFRGNPIHQGIDDTYYNVDETGTIHPPAVELWICQDTWFEVSDKGMRYIETFEPEGSQQEDFN